MDLRAIWLRWRHSERTAEAREERLALACELLRSGEELPQDVRDAIADAIEERPRRGRPSKPPTKWFEVGKAYESGEFTIDEVAARLGVQKRTAQRGLAYYRAGKAADDDI